jgi:hypothetical protein
MDMLANVLIMTSLLVLGGVLVLAMVVMLMAAIDFLQNGGRDD